ncbi:hypothetical protein ACFE04_004913 [Oxalis oulophora]
MMIFNAENLPWISNHHRRIFIIVMLFLTVAITSWTLYYDTTTDPFEFLPTSLRSSLFLDYYMGKTTIVNFSDPPVTFSEQLGNHKLYKVLSKATMDDNKTVIITTLNKAWAQPGSLLDVFLASFKIGNGTCKYLNHLVIVSMDQEAHSHCLMVHPHCYKLNTTGNNFSSEAYFMTQSYLEMMWKRIDFMISILEMGFNFVFTDADIMWLQDPFPRFYPDADFQIACDRFNGRPNDTNNAPNGGFNYVKSNNKTIQFYKYWYSSRLTYPDKHDQDVLNKIKKDSFLSEIGLQIMFLDTKYFGGFCQLSKDYSRICTMHANCCYGLGNKILDLKIVLQDWRCYTKMPPNIRAKHPALSWRVPRSCSLRNFHPPNGTRAANKTRTTSSRSL